MTTTTPAPVGVRRALIVDDTAWSSLTNWAATNRHELREIPVGPGQIPRYLLLHTATDEQLGEREMQVLTGIAQGMGNAEIGRIHYLGENTIKTYCRRLFGKLGARDRGTRRRHRVSARHLGRHPQRQPRGKPVSYTAPIRRVDTAKGHYYADANGERVPGVTTILSGGLPKPALINWAANSTAEYAVDHWDDLTPLSPSQRLKKLQGARYEEKDRAANRGTEVHGLAEKLVKGEEIDVPDLLAGHVEAYVQLLDDFRIEPVLIEVTVVSHQYGYAGTLDLIADFPTLGKRLLCDLKTNRSGIFGETALQLAGYRYADTYIGPDGAEVPMIAVDGCAAIHVRADGADLIPVTAGELQLRQLRYAQQVAAFDKTSRDLVGNPVPPPAASQRRRLEIVPEVAA
jgi:DNA-binding CsgD family transcriptional regulator